MRKILHVDLDAFFCSVEELLDPSLRNIAFATGGTSEGRGVVTSCSYAARKFGVHSAMPMGKALRLCPQLVAVRGHYQKYSEFSTKVMDIFRDITPLVEKISIDEAFLDVSDLPENPRNIAVEIQSRVKRETGLPCSIGSASNKLVAKIATNIGKANHNKPNAPMAIYVIPSGKEVEFLKPLPIQEMWGIGPKSARIMSEKGLNHIGDIQSIPINELEKIIGNFASVLKKRALGIDHREVGNYEGVKSISNERTFFTNLSNTVQVNAVIKDLSEKVARRLRMKGLIGKTVRLKIRWSNFETITRQLTLDQPTNHDSVIYNSIKGLLNENWVEGKGIRLIGVGVSKLEEDVYQLSLFNKNYEKERRLLEAIDDLSERYGKEIIRKGSSEKRY
jgi:DNA polymerase-4